MDESPKEWWGQFTFAEGQTTLWEIASLRVAVQRLPAEWLVAYEQFEENEESLAWHFDTSDTNIKDEDWPHISRFVSQSTTEQVMVRPALADRSVVSRPITPFSVQADEMATVFIGTPLWFTLRIGSQEEPLFEIPIHRPSDTWFGPSTLKGELCYASRTYARLNLENVPVDPRWATTRLHIENRSDEPLPVERISLPVPFLSLFATADGELWTETVKMAEERKTSLAKFDMEEGPPPAAAGAKPIVPPRQPPRKGMLVSAFSILTLKGFD